MQIEPIAKDESTKEWLRGIIYRGMIKILKKNSFLREDSRLLGGIYSILLELKP